MKIHKVKKKYGRLTVIKEIEKRGEHRYFLCQCSCGTERNISRHGLIFGGTKSCGCLQRDVASSVGKTHGHIGKRQDYYTFQSWVSMLNRCNNPSMVQYKDYGGRGIKYVKRWNNFKNFLRDMGKRPEGKTLNRIDNDKGYSKQNCNWATRKEQNTNKRSNIMFRGECAADASTRLGGEKNMVRKRIKRGWEMERAFTLPTKSSAT